jgi:hypothetical protein
MGVSFFSNQGDQGGRCFNRPVTKPQLPAPRQEAGRDKELLVKKSREIKSQEKQNFTRNKMDKKSPESSLGVQRMLRQVLPYRGIYSIQYRGI